MTQAAQLNLIGKSRSYLEKAANMSVRASASFPSNCSGVIGWKVPTIIPSPVSFCSIVISVRAIAKGLRPVCLASPKSMSLAPAFVRQFSRSLVRHFPCWRIHEQAVRSLGCAVCVRIAPLPSSHEPSSTRGRKPTSAARSRVITDGPQRTSKPLVTTLCLALSLATLAIYWQTSRLPSTTSLPEPRVTSPKLVQRTA